VHVCGGTAALVGAILVGSRGSKTFENNQKKYEIPGHSMPLVMIGTGLACTRDSALNPLNPIIPTLQQYLVRTDPTSLQTRQRGEHEHNMPLLMEFPHSDELFTDLCHHQSCRTPLKVR
jgi:hypothetical protein